ncbi:hypothetical protein CMI40_00400 [Candidatus Pacearchaeota archaeon]|jgi:hypothetical protein|nr:hypothetical protein [Candidatus Pacearchaeota archaeon]|tara:strand:+ start:4733 stop:5650 length:918 start_codon:yes stop_codon:yes gene_type:complete
MTVINMLGLKEAGIVAADEQASTDLRKTNVSQKLHKLGKSFVYGGSGPINMLGRVYKLSNNNIKELMETKGDFSLNDAYNIVNQEIINYKNQQKNNVLLASVGINLENFLTSQINGVALGEDTKKAGINFLNQVDEKFAMTVLLGGMENGKFGIYSSNTSGIGGENIMNYSSIGSGADESDKILSSYIASLSRDQRERIEPKEGIVKIIEATNASKNINQGVGGSLGIAYVPKNDVPIIPSDNQCILAGELVEGLTRNFLDKVFVYDKVFELVTQDGDFIKIKKEMQNTSKNWDEFDRILRGYKG